jgi:hypothetical protein
MGTKHRESFFRPEAEKTPKPPAPQGVREFFLVLLTLEEIRVKYDIEAIP